MPSLFDLARRRVGTDAGINPLQRRPLGMPGGTPGPTGYGSNAGGTDAGIANADRILGMPGNTAGPTGYGSGGMFGTGGGAAKTNFGGGFGNMGNGGSWTNTNNPLSGGLLGNLPGFNKPTGWANGVDPKYMGGVTQGGTGGALPGAMNQWLNNPALIQAREAFQGQMRDKIARQMQEAGAIGGAPVGSDVFGNAPSPEMVAQNQALQQFKSGLAGKSNQEIDAMYESLVEEAGLNKNTPANALTNMKMQALRDYGNSQGFYNWLTPEQKTEKLWANGSPW